MTDQQKTIAFWAGIVFAGILAVFFIVSIQQKLDTAPTTNQVSFNGEGKVEAKPDVALADFSIVTTGTTSKAAQDANSARSKKVYDFLKKQGVNEKDIKTTYYNITPQYSSGIRPMPLYYNGSSGGGVGIETQMAPQSYPIPVPGGDTNKITGYQVTQSYQVKIRDLDKASVIVDGLVSAGANQVTNVSFDFENRDKIMNEARAKAIADAKQKADDLRKQIGIRLGKIINYSDNSMGYPYPYEKMYATGMGGGGEPSGPILPPGQNEITVSVTITYQIK